MTKPELIAGLQRLYDGFSRSRVDLTPERLEALFQNIGFHSSAVWQKAVEMLLCETRFPDFDMIHSAIDQASEQQRLRDNEQADRDAKRFLSGELNPGAYAHNTDHEYGLFRLKVLIAVTEGATPNDVAAMLESQARRWDGYGLRAEARRYRSMPNWNPSLQHPTWWERQQAAEKAARAQRQRDVFESVRGTKPPDESWPGWREMGFQP